MHQRDEGPSAFAWLVAFISLVLPWAGIALGLFGIWTIAQNEPAGWWFLIAGGAMFIADPLIDLIWAHRAVLKTDQPDLNRRNQQEEAIEGGRGKVRVGDTLWPAEGPDTPAGMLVRVTAAQGTVLVVERAS